MELFFGLAPTNTRGMAAAVREAYRRVAQVSAGIFGNIWNPTYVCRATKVQFSWPRVGDCVLPDFGSRCPFPSNARNGYKHLRRLPVPESVIDYYPAPLHRFKSNGMFQDFDAVYWREKAEEARKRGRGPPKKGSTIYSFCLFTL